MPTDPIEVEKREMLTRNTRAIQRQLESRLAESYCDHSDEDVRDYYNDLAFECVALRRLCARLRAKLAGEKYLPRLGGDTRIGIYVTKEEFAEIEAAARAESVPPPAGPSGGAAE